MHQPTLHPPNPAYHPATTPAALFWCTGAPHPPPAVAALPHAIRTPAQAIVDRERSSGSYHLSAYFLAKTCSEAPCRLLMPLFYVNIA